jgi:hypothetical protein
MPTSQFEPDAPGFITGTISATVTSAGGNPQTIFKASDPWSIRVDWQLNGPGVLLASGDWHVRAFLESMGPGFEGQVGPTVDEPVGAPATSHSYSRTISVPASVAPPRVYELTVLVTHTLPAAVGGGAGPFAAFEQGQVLQLIP